MSLILTWLLQALALMVVAYILPGVTVASFGAALIAAVILGLINTIVYPVLVFLTIPITIVTLGLFLFVLNALLFWLAGSLFNGFQVDGFWWALAGALVYSIISGILLSLLN
ncbi:phage holin family protein [Advenella alkanexedens]|uniref:Phage holin family protein n=1 Tax=Advenella alkanexedens TaxID=1481665 RepID=A0ABS6NRQ5_9BURK|nr:MULTISPECIES: phage holin family protein [Advenella]MBV4398324.1 phage holin family protein [Advenella alkanexedens]MDD3758653.1 phage holin family protein [Advenella sp.]